MYGVLLVSKIIFTYVWGFACVLNYLYLCMGFVLVYKCIYAYIRG